MHHDQFHAFYVEKMRGLLMEDRPHAYARVTAMCANRPKAIYAGGASQSRPQGHRWSCVRHAVMQWLKYSRHKTGAGPPDTAAPA